VVPVGYGHGLSHRLSNKGMFLFRGVRVPVIGRVTMDMTMVDVTGIDCQCGDVATLLGRADSEHIDINEIAARVDILSYELLVGLKLRAPRIHHGAGA